MNIEPRKAAVWQAGLIPNPKAKLRDQFHEVMRFKHFSQRTEEAYWQWVLRFLKFYRQGKTWRHPKDLPETAMAEFLSDLATRLKVAAATQNQTFNALLFLYKGRAACGAGGYWYGGACAAPGKIADCTVARGSQVRAGGGGTEIPVGAALVVWIGHEIDGIAATTSQGR